MTTASSLWTKYLTEKHISVYICPIWYLRATWGFRTTMLTAQI